MNTTSHNKGCKLPPEPLTSNEVLALMATCSASSIGLRDRALIAVLWRGQLRIEESLALKPSDFCADFCTLRVLHGKGDKTRVAVVDQGTVDVMAVWMERRLSLGINGHQPIFCTLKGGQISTAQIRKMLPRRAKKAVITKRCHAHGLRHSGASELAAANFELLDIQNQLGHSSPATTARYLHQLNPVARIERLSKRTW